MSNLVNKPKHIEFIYQTLSFGIQARGRENKCSYNHLSFHVVLPYLSRCYFTEQVMNYLRRTLILYYGWDESGKYPVQCFFCQPPALPPAWPHPRLFPRSFHRTDALEGSREVTNAAVMKGPKNDGDQAPPSKASSFPMTSQCQPRCQTLRRCKYRPCRQKGRRINTLP